jgi:hypothetical protein
MIERSLRPPPVAPLPARPIAAVIQHGGVAEFGPTAGPRSIASDFLSLPLTAEISSSEG